MARENEWIARYRRPYNLRLKLFCFPYAGGGPAAFRGWAETLKDAGVEVCGIRLPARDIRVDEEPLLSVFDAVAPITLTILRMLDGPYALYGHSLGAILAFETARALRREGASEPEHLLASASQAPQLPWNHPPMRDLECQPFLREIQARYGDIPGAVLNDRELLDLLLPGLRADVHMVETYRYSPEAPLDCPVTVYGGIQDKMVTRQSLDAWREQTTNTFRFHMVPGDHFCLPAVQRRLIHDLDSAQEGSALSA